jgi:predicted dienelactone hydrolase
VGAVEAEVDPVVEPEAADEVVGVELRVGAGGEVVRPGGLPLVVLSRGRGGGEQQQAEQTGRAHRRGW